MVSVSEIRTDDLDKAKIEAAVKRIVEMHRQAKKEGRALNFKTCIEARIRQFGKMTTEKFGRYKIAIGAVLGEHGGRASAVARLRYPGQMKLF